MKKTIRKRALSLALCAVMLLGMLPVSALADTPVASLSVAYVHPMGTEGAAATSAAPTTWKSAMARIQPGGTIYVMKDPVKIQSAMTIGADWTGNPVTVKPYYNTLNSSDSDNLTGYGANSLIMVQNGCDVEISNMIFDGGDRPDGDYYDFLYVDNGSLTLNNCVVQNFTNESYGAAINVYSGATVTLNDTTVTNNKTGKLDGAGDARGGVTVGGTLHVNGNSVLTGNKLYPQYSSRDVVEDIYVSHGGKLNLAGTATVGFIVFSTAKTDEDVVHITSALQSDINIHKHIYNAYFGVLSEGLATGNLMAEGTGGYTLTDGDIGHIKVSPGGTGINFHAFKNADNQAYNCMDFRIYPYPYLVNGSFVFSSSLKNGVRDVLNPGNPPTTQPFYEAYCHYGAPITVTTKPNPGYHYKPNSMQVTDWNDNDASGRMPLTQVPGKNQWTFTVPTGLPNNTVQLSCTFEANPYTLTINGGTDGTDGSLKYWTGDVVTITAPGVHEKRFTGWQVDSGDPKIADIRSALTTLTMPAENAEITAVYVDDETLHEVQGDITVEGGGTLDGPPTAILVRNGVKFPATVSAGAPGAAPFFYYNYVPSGEYNLVVTAKIGGKTVTTTVLISVLTVDVDQNVILPSGDYNSRVTFDGTGTPNIEGGGLDEIAKKLGSDPANTKVLIELKVEKNDDSLHADDVNAAITADKLTSGVVMDLDLWKTVNTETAEKILVLNEATHGKDLVTVTFHLPASIQGKDGYAIYRYHDTGVDKITETPNLSGEYIVVDAAKTTVKAQLGRFSTYAIAYKSGGGGGSGGGSTRYTLTYESNGGTAYTSEQYAYGTTVPLDKIPKREGFAFTGWYADKALSKKIIEIKMTDGKTVYAGWQRSDVPTVPKMLNGDDHFAYVSGYADGTVRPLNNITRAEVSMLFYRLLHEETRAAYQSERNTFLDVTGAMWCNTAISTMTEIGVVRGRAENAFDPNAAITRGEFAVICSRFDDGAAEVSATYTDITGHWAQSGIERAAALGWIQGYTDGTFHPDNYITRAEAITIINRMLCRMPETAADLTEGRIQWPDNTAKEWYYLAVEEATNGHNYERKEDGAFEVWTALREK